MYIRMAGSLIKVKEQHDDKCELKHNVVYETESTC
jgi:hypothetical protein